MTRHATILAAFLAMLLVGHVRADDGGEFFEKRIRPVLAENCYKCHSAQSEKLKGKLRLDSREAILKGGETGPALVPGEPEKSLLIKAIRYLDEDLQMPPKTKLADQSIRDLEAWVKMGAPFPVAMVAAGRPVLTATKAPWPYGPVHRPAIPSVHDRNWAASPIDHFILAQLEKKGLKPAPEADRRTLIRRVTYDLLGLPPTAAEVEAFVTDTSPNAYPNLIDRLLASPQYGQRWARHWLDLVRYTDSFDARGTGGAKDCSDAWRYRDWVVDAFNHDLPYDQFIQRQVAGDLMGDVIPTGVYAIGNWGGGDADKEKLLTDIVDDQIDLTGRVFLGVTLACARCHDHKFDPILQEDYYGLAGIFFSSHILPNVGPKTDGPDMLKIPLLSKQQVEQRNRDEARAKELEKKIDAAAGGLLARRLSKVAGREEISGFGGDQPPVVLFNRSDKAIGLGTLTIPGHALSMHPSPKGAVGAVWKSPIEGRIQITGRVNDGDNKCGDGIDWSLKLNGKELAKGAIPNGGSATFPIKIVEVRRGDEIELAIGPKAEYTCDTTIIELSIRETTGPHRQWNLPQDVVQNPGVGNPHPDALGNPAVWAFYDLAKPRTAAGTFAELSQWRAELEPIKARLATPLPTAEGLQEGGVPASPQAGLHDVKVHIRGRYDRLGNLVARRFPLFLAGDHQLPITAGSGRMNLATWLSSPTNPMTARVMVNRLWQHHFGQGIVRTPNNFGKLGTPPTHPELLDYIASEFIANGWSIKQLHREILLSSAYRQSSIGNEATMKADPDNLLFGRMNRQRLDAEELRDALLAVSGKLDPSLSGPAVKDLSSSRRTLYLMTIRSDRSNYRSLFDAADPTAIIDQRIDSTVAPQALFLMNHPFMLDQAAELAAKAKQQKEPLDWLYRRLYSREPTPREIQIIRQLIEHDGWEACCQALLCANEFVYID
jgi:hypothetical protein